MNQNIPQEVKNTKVVGKNFTSKISTKIKQ